MKKGTLLCGMVIALAALVTFKDGFAYQIEPQATKSDKIILKFENW